MEQRPLSNWRKEEGRCVLQLCSELYRDFFRESNQDELHNPSDRLLQLRQTLEQQGKKD